MKTVDRILGWLLILGGIGHGLGCLKAYSHQPAYSAGPGICLEALQRIYLLAW